MYGLINKAIEDMVCTRFGEEVWLEIKQGAGVETEVFVGMDAYPDDLTHRLVGAASTVLGLSGAQILEAFGEYWVLYTAREGYGPLLNMAGENLPEFLENLDELHARVGLSFPQLKPPSFACTHQREGALELEYRSTRQGLAPMVVGLVKGLGCRFGVEVEIAHSPGPDHDAFSISYKPE